MGERSRQRVGRAAATVAPCRPGRASSPSPRPRLRLPRPSSWGSPRSRPTRPRVSPSAPAASGGAPVDARARCPRRPRGGRAAARRATVRRRPPRRRGPEFARFDSLEARVGQAFSAWPDGTSTASTGSPGFTPRRPSSSSTSASPSSGRAGGGRGRLAGGRRLGAGHAVRDRRREPAPSRVRPRRPALRHDRAAPEGLDDLAPAAQLDLLGEAPRRARTGSSSTASRCSGSGGSVLPCASSTPRRRRLRTTSRRRSRPRSGGSTRRDPPRRSRASGR